MPSPPRIRIDHQAGAFRVRLLQSRNCSSRIAAKLGSACLTARNLPGRNRTACSTRPFCLKELLRDPHPGQLHRRQGCRWSCAPPSFCRIRKCRWPRRSCGRESHSVSHSLTQSSGFVSFRTRARFRRGIAEFVCRATAPFAHLRAMNDEVQIGVRTTCAIARKSSSPSPASLVACWLSDRQPPGGIRPRLPSARLTPRSIPSSSCSYALETLLESSPAIALAPASANTGPELHGPR